MTHEDEGHYAAKHPNGTTVAQTVSEAIRMRVRDGGIPCSAAHRIAADLAVPTAMVGTGIDLQEARITRCQLGLFGYGKGKKMVTTPDGVEENLAGALADAAMDRVVTCSICWRIADEMEIARLEVACACEGLGIKIRQCQLGAF